jgi:hypothetical protein
MLDKTLLNDPEYRWYHKRELQDIMPHYTKRKELGIESINYHDLRLQFLNTIKEKPSNNLNWKKFEYLIDIVPNNLNKSIKKTSLQPADMLHFEKRDGCNCYLCGTISRYTQFHHIRPNGGVSDDNIVTLCLNCHKLVHLALYKSGKWKYIHLM